MPLHLGVDALLQPRVDVPSVEGLIGAPENLDVLLRHRPRSISRRVPPSVLPTYAQVVAPDEDVTSPVLKPPQAPNSHRVPSFPEVERHRRWLAQSVSTLENAAMPAIGSPEA